jgi:DNA polymerase delta subunit 2
MKLKPSCLKGMENMYGITKVEKYIDEKDTLSLEDSSGRVKIDKMNSKLNVNEFVSGIPCALKGKLNEKGVYVVDEYLYYKPDSLSRNETPMDIDSNNLNNNQNLILFISNLKIGKPQEYDEGLSPSARTMLADFIQNHNLNNELNDISNRIKRVIFVGDSVYVNDKIEELEKGSYIKAEEYKNEVKDIINSYTLLDKYLKVISSYVHVDLINSIEGNDGVYFPQNPNSQLLFLDNLVNINAKTLNLVPNPYNFEIYSHKTKTKKTFLGTSGENINNILQFTDINDPLVAMEKTIEWGHLAPLAPDTLRIYPYSRSDPLLLNNIPDVYFISGKNDLNKKVINLKTNGKTKKEVLLIELPDFSSTFKGVILNVDDESIREINFSQELSFLTEKK